MSTITLEQVNKQIRDNFQAALKKITTGVLKNSPEDNAFTERLVVQWFFVNKLELEPTEANFSKAITALAPLLPWKTKPARLLADERETKTTIIPTAIKPGDDQGFEARKRASEAVDAKAKADEETIKQVKSLISGFNPVKNNRYAAREREDQEKYWASALGFVVAGKSIRLRDPASADTKATIVVNGLKNFVKWLEADIQKRYADLEKASQYSRPVGS